MSFAEFLKSTVFKSKAVKLLEKAEKLRLEGDLEAALVIYNNAIAEDPKLANAYVGRGSTYS